MMGASRAVLLGGWLHVCWAATRLLELAPSPEDVAPNSIALSAAGGSMADGKTTGGGDPCVPRARADVRAQEPSFELVEVPQELEDVRPQGGDEGR